MFWFLYLWLPASIGVAGAWFSNSVPFVPAAVAMGAGMLLTFASLYVFMPEKPTKTPRWLMMLMIVPCEVFGAFGTGVVVGRADKWLGMILPLVIIGMLPWLTEIMYKCFHRKR